MIFLLLYILAGKTRSGPQPSVREEIPIKRTFGLYEKYFISSIFLNFLWYIYITYISNGKLSVTIAKPTFEGFTSG